MPDSTLPVTPQSASAPKPSSALERQLAAQRARRPVDPLLSLVVPVFNEEESIGIFLTTVEPFLERAGLRFEIVFVNDGSRDDTLSRLLDCSRADARIRVVNLSRNFGKEAALTAGIDHAKGDILIPMDIDLQDPPDLFGPFIERWREGYDIVYGVRSARTWDTMSKRLSASWFYWAFNRMSPVRIPANGSLSSALAVSAISPSNMPAPWACAWPRSMSQPTSSSWRNRSALKSWSMVRRKTRSQQSRRRSAAPMPQW